MIDNKTANIKKNCSLSIVYTTTDQKLQKSKNVIFSASHWHLGDMTVGNILQFLARDVINTSRVYATCQCPSVCDGSALVHYS